MARRKKDPFLEALPALVGLLFVGIAFSPQFRALLFWGVACLLVGGIVVLICLSRIRAAQNRDKRIESCLSVSIGRPDKQQDKVPNLQPGVNPDPSGPKWINWNKPIEGTIDSQSTLSKVRAIDWYQFEKLVGVMYRKLGYEVERRGGAKADGGIDLIIRKDGDQTAVQCKQWKTWNVGVKAIREFLVALTDAGIKKGIFITLCGYTGEAKQLADKHGIEILNETDLVQI